MKLLTIWFLRVRAPVSPAFKQQFIPNRVLKSTRFRVSCVYFLRWMHELHWLQLLLSMTQSSGNWRWRTWRTVVGKKGKQLGHDSASCGKEGRVKLWRRCLTKNWQLLAVTETWPTEHKICWLGRSVVWRGWPPFRDTNVYKDSKSQFPRRLI